MKRLPLPSPTLSYFVGVCGIAAMAFVGGAFFGGAFDSDRGELETLAEKLLSAPGEDAASSSLSGQVPEAWRALALQADTASTGKQVAVATGRVNDSIECLYVLDTVNLNLMCFVISSRNGQLVGTYGTNIANFFGPVRPGDFDFTLATGFINLNEGGRVGPARVAENLCYVVEGNTGVALAFSFTFNQTLLQNLTPQQGPLNLVWQTLIRDPALNPQPGVNPAGGNPANPAQGGNNNAAAGGGN